ncbi:MAG: aldehyde dehydrogenase family protein, partial [Fibrobacteraceae bacterium]|nr:aldehyde dehydrogenase family protein [Fibrobacteraceae bacterium]
MQFESSEQLKEIFDLQGKRRWQVAKTTAKERIQKLKKLRAAIVTRQQEFYDAVWEDFHKSKFEA